MEKKLQISIIGLTITSSWGNGHATTYRSLIKALHEAGHSVTFYEQDVYWYACARDLLESPYCNIELYPQIKDLKSFGDQILASDLIIVGSFVAGGIEIGDWIIQEATGVKAFYDIDTPVTLSALQNRSCSYLREDQIPQYDMYLSITNGPLLEILESEYHSPCPLSFPCSVDPSLYFPEPMPLKWDLGYMGTYSPDRQEALNRLLLYPAEAWPQGRFVVAGSQYPDDIKWPGNVERIHHLPPHLHREFYNQQRFTLNLTRKNMVESGYSPSVRLYEAAACGTPIISDWWLGLDELFKIGEEILISKGVHDTLTFLQSYTEEQRCFIGSKARQVVVKKHSAHHRAQQLEEYYNLVSSIHQF